MAKLIVSGDMVTVSLTAMEKVETLKGDISFPRAAVITASAVPSGMAELHGMRVGTGLPGVIAAGTWHYNGQVTFAVCHGNGPAVVLELASQQYQRIVLTVDDPQQVLASLGGY